MKKSAFVVSIKSDIEAANEYQSRHPAEAGELILGQNELNYQISGITNKYYGEIAPNCNGDIFLNILRDWYLDDAGVDYTIAKDRFFSWGALLSCQMAYLLPLLYREIMALEALLKKYDKVYFPENYQVRRVIDQLIGVYPGRIFFYQVKEADHRLITLFRIFRPDYKIHPIKHILSLLSVPFRRWIVRGKNIFINDWTFEQICAEDPRGLMLNMSRLKKNLFVSGKISSQSKKEISYENYAQLPVLELLQKNFRKYGFSEHLAQVLMTLMSQDLMKNIPYYQGVFSLYLRVFECRPNSITVSTDIFDEHNLCLQMAQHFKIKSRCLADGYPLFFSCPYLSKGKNQYYFDELLVSSRRFADEISSNTGFPMSSIHLVKPYSKASVASSESQTKTYDCLIYTLIPNSLGPYYDFSGLAEYLAEACRVAQSFGHKKIAIKLKAELERHYVEGAVKALQLPVEVICMPSLSVLSKTKMVIGGISSAIFESKILGVEYYMFEPHKNGYWNSLYERSHLIRPKDNARDGQTLMQHIQEKRIALSEVTLKDIFN